MKRIVRPIIQASMILLGAATLCPASRLTPNAQSAFDRYIEKLEIRLKEQHTAPETYIAALDQDPNGRANAERLLRSGVVRVEPVNGGTRQLSGALLHHWRAAAFVNGGKRRDMLALLRDYNRLSTYYAPEVESSHALASDGDVGRVAVRLRKQEVVTVIIDAIYEVQTGSIGSTGGYGFSWSTHIWQVDEPGTPRERRRPEGDDDGFLWRLNAYWSFLQLRDGLLIECEAVSLTRDIPIGLGWLVEPIIEDLPRSSLEFTLNATKKALTQMAFKEEY
ncbi:MAG: hypothetical protein JO097_07910 [Acidobacteriaceae bacterium]|nr:hypothetical protein [Acidobacteriaceae bacterium]